MRVTFDNCLVCDVRKTTFENKTYYSLVVYQDGKLYRISIPQDAVKTFKEVVGQSFSLEANMSVYDGKVKFKLIQD